LLYFFSPGCAACRPLTPRFQEMSERRPKSVFVVNVADELGLARALGVMATPSIVEVENGVIANYHVGRPPEQLMQRWA
jgi:thioredoxin 1